MAWLSLISFLIGCCLVTVYGYTNCYDCRYSPDPDTCNHSTTCNSNEVCYTSTTVVGPTPVYTFGCMSAGICQVVMKTAFADLDTCHGVDLSDPNVPLYLRDQCGEFEVGKRGVRSTQICTACCNDDGCNLGSCVILKEKWYLAYKQGTFDLQTLKSTATMTTSGGSTFMGSTSRG